MAENDDTKMTAMQRIQALAQAALESSETRQAETPQQLFLPGFDLGAMPNHINRSSLFAPVARGRRKFHRQQRLVSRPDAVLEYTGEQLDEADCDLMMALIYTAQPSPIGEWVPINRAELLRKIGRSTGKHDYEWLHRRMRSMTESTLYVEARRPDGGPKYKLGSSEAFHLVSGFRYDEDAESYLYRLDPRWVQMFAGREYTLLDFERRLQIGRGQDMAKTLQRQIATSNESPQRYGLEWLKRKMEYSGRMRDFRAALLRAVKELERLDIIASGKIEASNRGTAQLTLWLP